MEIVLYVIKGGGHTWPGRDFGPELKVLDRSTENIYANDLIRAFFKNHQCNNRRWPQPIAAVIITFLDFFIKYIIFKSQRTLTTAVEENNYYIASLNSPV